ncbi:hypothetical protein PC117_g11505 [Phytophthora cactorum]|uniref:Uncharacterized protein n=1 Tax=Phytophthora cactorum TaxID=29920 RepID=A0A8T1D911_9STRA|nr:hypothetical protein PC117_g11505 [Phytophthora cactorum]
MFLTAVARPRCDLATGIQFDGKLGIWPFVEQRAAIRDSERRPAGTIETKSINVTKWFCAAVEEYGRRVELVFQLLNSPD